MKIKIQKEGERGLTKLAWLTSKHSFNFGQYHNPDREKFGTLLVVNEDIVSPKQGFEMHKHENMEIITIMLSGKIEHQDTLGNVKLIEEGDIQKISAGTGIMHSEINPDFEKAAHFLQIWIEPKSMRTKPDYAQVHLTPENYKNQLVEIAGDTVKSKLKIKQEAAVMIGEAEKYEKLYYSLRNPLHGLFLLVIEGKISLEDKILVKGDSAEITKVKSITLTAQENSRVLLIDVPVD